MATTTARGEAALLNALAAGSCPPAHLAAGSRREQRALPRLRRAARSDHRPRRLRLVARPGRAQLGRICPAGREQHARSSGPD